MGRIVLEGVSKSFGSVPVLRDVDLDIAEGEFVVFVGPSGCGKSTLLRLITGLEPLSAGRIEIDGVDVTDKPPAERELAMVFQSYALYPHMTVRGNIAFGLKIAGLDRASIEKKVADAARLLELEALLERKPRELSGGQRQRVAIGRAIVRSPTAFLFDEPLSNLDAALRVQMRMELIGLHRSFGKTMIYVTHDQTEAMTMADRIVVLNRGNVEQFDTPLAIYDHPRNLFVAGFIGSPRMNFIDVVPAGGSSVRLGNGTVIELPGYDPAAFGERMTLGVRPEFIAHGRDGEGWEATVAVKEQLGSDAILHVEMEGVGMLVVRAVGERGFGHGERIVLRPDPALCHLFDADGQALPRRG